jgi:hypothetical protein
MSPACQKNPLQTFFYIHQQNLDDIALVEQYKTDDIDNDSHVESATNANHLTYEDNFPMIPSPTVTSKYPSVTTITLSKFTVLTVNPPQHRDELSIPPMFLVI